MINVDVVLKISFFSLKLQFIMPFLLLMFLFLFGLVFLDSFRILILKLIYYFGEAVLKFA